VEDNGKTAGESLPFLHMNATERQMFSYYAQENSVFVEENQKIIAQNVQNIQFWIDNPQDSIYTILE